MGRRIFINIMALGGAQAVAMVCSLITAVVLARALGPAVYGVLGFGVALLSYFGLLVNMGMDVHGVREISRRPTHAERLVRLILGTRLLFAVVLFAVLYAAIPVFGWSEQVRGVLLIQGLGMFGVALTIDFYYQAEQRMGISALRQGSAAILAVVAVLVLIQGPDDLLQAAGIPVAAQIFTALLMLAFYWRNREAGMSPEGTLSRLRFVRRAAPVALMGVLITIYINIDIVILGYMVAEAEVGRYVAASRVVIMAVIVPNLVHSAFLPALSKAFGDDVACRAASENHARAVGLLGGAVAGVGLLFTPEIIDILFGAAFAGATDALRLLMIHVLVFYLTAAYGTPLLAWQCDKPYTMILVLGAAVNIGLNFALIPVYGITGAAFATLVTQVLIWLSLMALAQRAFGLMHYGLMGRVLLVSAGSYFLFRLLIVDGGVLADGGPWLTLVVGGVGYLILYGVLSVAAGVVALSDVRGMLRDAD